MDFEPQTAQWWLNRLIARMSVQSSIVMENERWYTGRHPLPVASATNSELYKNFQQMSVTNMVAKVVDVAQQRLSITGVRTGDQEMDEHLWDLWQGSQMDSEQDSLFNAALALGISYISVWPDEDGVPRFYPEHPLQVVHVPKPGRPREVAAALKLFYDELTMYWTAVMYLPDRILKWYSLAAFESVSNYSQMDIEEIENPFGIIPIIPLRNQPTLTGWYVSEMADAIPIQKRINQTTLNMLVAQEAVAFPQRWATGLELDRDENGQVARPFKSSPDALWVAEDTEVKFGQFAESNFTAYLESLRQDTELIASVTNTPAFNLGSHLRIPPSAEALSAMEASLIKKVRQRQLVFGEAVEHALRYALIMEGEDPRDWEQIEVIWQDPRVRSDGQVGDFAVKMQAVGVPQEAIWAELGATPQMIQQWSEMQMAQAFRQLVTQIGDQQGTQDNDGPTGDRQIEADRSRPKQAELPQGSAEPFPGSGYSQDLNNVAGQVH